jgi:hypothetical protein
VGGGWGGEVEGLADRSFERYKTMIDGAIGARGEVGTRQMLRKGGGGEDDTR